MTSGPATRPYRVLESTGASRPRPLAVLSLLRSSAAAERSRWAGCSVSGLRSCLR
jgi:hypothetical protein